MTKKDAEVTDLRWLLMQVQALPGCSDTKARVVRLLRSQAGSVIRIRRSETLVPERIERARHLLATDSVPVVRDRLCSRYGIARSTAYNIIRAAMRHGDN